MNKKPVIWLTGLSGSGKTTLSKALYNHFQKNDMASYLLDGDVIRTGLCSDLGFSIEDRNENIRRISEVSKLISNAGIITITAFISPLRAHRDFCRSILQKEQFIEVFIDCPLSTCEDRDVKGLYKKARNNEISNFTGISSPYETPINPEITVQTNNMKVSECLDVIISYLKKHSVVI